LDDKLLSLVSEVIQRSTRQRWADAVLRDLLKRQGGLSRNQSAAISRAVFSYYRWFGWLEPSGQMDEQIDRAKALAERFAQQPASFSDDELVARGVPRWLKEETEISPQWIRALQAEPRLWLRARRGQGKALAEKLGDSHVLGEGLLSDILEYRGGKDLFRTREFHVGEFELQDLSSQAVGFVCAPLSGETWWDACAGEGGKTLHLSDLMENKGLIWATDRVAWRLEKFKRRAARARAFNYRTGIWEGGPKLATKTKFDGVLVDAPCSGIGTWQRNPQARWTTTLEDVKELSKVQEQILVNVGPAVKPGGKLFYAVCTSARSETDGVVDAFERQCPEFKRLELPDPLAAGLGPERQLYLRPQRFGGNGMFIAAWRRGG